MKTLYLTILLAAPFFAHSQDMTSIESDLLAKYQRIDYWWTHSRDNPKIDGYDSLVQANKDFQRALSTVAASYPTSISYSFKRLRKAGVLIATSSDGRLRIYSWDTEKGGTMHFFLNVFQWLYGQSTHSKAGDADSVNEGDPGVFCDPIYTLAAPACTYYLVVNSSIGSTRDNSMNIQAMRIDGQSINDSVQIFKTRTGLTNLIGFSFDFFSIVDQPELRDHLIQFDSAKQRVLIPVVLQDGTVTDRQIVYKWAGKYFERETNVPNKTRPINPRLAPFKAFSDSFFTAIKKGDTAFLRAHILFPIRNSTFFYFDHSLQNVKSITAAMFFKRLPKIFSADILQDIRVKGAYDVSTFRGKTEYWVEVFYHEGGVDSNAKWFFIKKGKMFYFTRFYAEVG